MKALHVMFILIDSGGSEVLAMYAFLLFFYMMILTT